MITIVAHFWMQVVKFIFGGRNSGQQESEAGMQMPAEPEQTLVQL
jgi:hypothetical protein